MLAASAARSLSGVIFRPTVGAGDGFPSPAFFARISDRVGMVLFNSLGFGVDLLVTVIAQWKELEDELIPDICIS